jgi:hypothetical protein
MHLVADVRGQVIGHPLPDVGPEGQFVVGEGKVHAHSGARLGAIARIIRTIVRSPAVPVATATP